MSGRGRTEVPIGDSYPAMGISRGGLESKDTRIDEGSE